MPKKPTRHNPQKRDGRTVQSAASVLQRISRKSGGVMPAPPPHPAATPPGPPLLDRLRTLLPLPLRPHLIDVLEKPAELVLFTDSAVWAGRLKLAAPELAVITGERRQVVRVVAPTRRQGGGLP